MIPRSKIRIWITLVIYTIVCYGGLTYCCHAALSWMIQPQLSSPQLLRSERQLREKNSLTDTPIHKLFKLPDDTKLCKNRQQRNSINRISSCLQASTSSEGPESKNRNDDYDEIFVMVNGMPGAMAIAAAEACLRKGLQLSPLAMTGPNVESSTITVIDPVTERQTSVRLISSTNVDEMNASLAGIQTAVGMNNLYAIDYTHPTAVNDNGRFYVRHNIPFVMGTTGGNREELLSDMQNGNIYCVIAPNMGKQIVAMQAALSELATKYPGAFAGYKLHVTESHQKTKADTSGTAKAVVDSIKLLSADTSFTYDDIEMIRDDSESIEFGVPADAIRGHAFHTYTLTSPDNSVQFQLQHNVAGRTVYADGTADAVKFLANKVRQQQQQLQTNTINDGAQERRVFNMMDVLQEGALE